MITLFSGRSNKKLANIIIERTQIVRPGLVTLGDIKVNNFSDGETHIEILENVRGKDVFIIQSLSNPANDNLVEMLLMADALRRSSAKSISAIIPYFGYARQDRRPRSARVPISARAIANMITAMGIERVVTVELHADQIQGFFDIPVDNIYSTKHFANDIKKLKLKDLIIVSPDVGGVLRARSLAKQVGDVDLVIIDKRRPAHNISEVMNIIGDVKNKNCIIVDDIIDTAGTICKAVDALFNAGALSVRAYCSHAVLSGHAFYNLCSSRITELVVTDTIHIDLSIKFPMIRQLSCADLLSEALLRIVEGNSLKDLQ